MREKSDKDIFSMDIHDVIKEGNFYITKVHNGWICKTDIKSTNGNSISLVFIPHNKPTEQLFHTKKL